MRGWLFAVLLVLGCGQVTEDPAPVAVSEADSGLEAGSTGQGGGFVIIRDGGEGGAEAASDAGPRTRFDEECPLVEHGPCGYSSWSVPAGSVAGCEFALQSDPEWAPIVTSPWDYYMNLVIDCRVESIAADPGTSVDQVSTPRMLYLGAETCELIQDGAEHRIDLAYGCITLK